MWINMPTPVTTRTITGVERVEHQAPGDVKVRESGATGSGNRCRRGSSQIKLFERSGFRGAFAREPLPRRPHKRMRRQNTADANGADYGVLQLAPEKEHEEGAGRWEQRNQPDVDRENSPLVDISLFARSKCCLTQQTTISANPFHRLELFRDCGRTR